MAELQAPASWRTVDFISDLHLQPAEPATFNAWRAYMAATPADAVFMLGDVFEAWVGDDAAGDTTGETFDADCAGVLRAAAQQRPVFFMHGNRDFLVGPALMHATGVTLLADPTVLAFQGMRWLLTHGDALCLDDHDYLAFRAKVREPHWQAAFLAQPLAHRRAIARGLRQESETRKETGVTYSDVDHRAARAWLQRAGATTLLHGHTHRPGEHDLGDGLRRVVLSDWDATATPPRLQVLRLAATGAQRLAAA